MIKLKRIEEPLLEPNPKHAWESGAVFNPGTVRDGDIVHVLYRAVESDNYSAIGYAKLDRNHRVLERRSEPAIPRLAAYESRGCEDPRIISFEGRYYIFYSAYNGTDVRVAMASTMDFKTFKRHGLVGPDVQDKDAMIFPETINGQLVYIHRIEPNIQFAFMRDIEHLKNPENGYWNSHLENLEKFTVLASKYEWEGAKIGASSPPIKTAEGWLFLYHGVDTNTVYRTGVALLDPDDPRKVIARLPYPILEPERSYEKIGDVPNVVFPEGTAVFDDELIVYYGAADKVVCAATVSLSALVEELKNYG